jgi:hypothetical protein
MLKSAIGQDIGGIGRRAGESHGRGNRRRGGRGSGFILHGLTRLHGLNRLNRVCTLTGTGLVGRKIARRRTTERVFIPVFSLNYSVKNILKARDSNTFPRLRNQAPEGILQMLPGPHRKFNLRNSILLCCRCQETCVYTGISSIQGIPNGVPDGIQCNKGFVQ